LLHTKTRFTGLFYEHQQKYTFYLRDAFWSDGTPITAYDFEYAWRKLIDPSSKSLTTVPELFYPIKNVRQFIAGNCDFEDVGITILDAKTILLELEYPTHYFLEIACSPFLFPAPKHIAEKDPDWADKPEFVCNGPFKLKKRRLNSEILLVKNSHYWDQKHVYLDGIDLYIVQDYQTAK